MGTSFYDKAQALSSFELPDISGPIPGGDMPGDVIKIGDGHIAKATLIMGELARLLPDTAAKGGKAVISVFGGSGVGKSEIASLLSHYLNAAGIGSYVLSGDNYPRRIPLYNDAERMSIFRAAGLKGLVAEGQYDEEIRGRLDTLWADETDADPARTMEYPWLACYQKAGRQALAAYLGTPLEQDYEELNGIIRSFKADRSPVALKRMGRTEDQRWYSFVDFSDIDVLIIEWTHGGNEELKGIDIPILLNSTPEETREHRRLRARDGKTDSAFTTMVLEIEQAELDARAFTAAIRISKSGELM